MSILRNVKTWGQTSTEIKVKEATNDNEQRGATGSLMNELSVLTYSPKTLREITQVVRRRLSGNYRKSSHKNAVHMLKTLTLILYLVNSGSNDFVAWIRSYAYLVNTLKEFTIGNSGSETTAAQIRSLASSLSELLRDDELLRRRRSEVTLFRSSISTPGRKSTDNSHLKPLAVIAVSGRSAEHTRSLDLSRRRVEAGTKREGDQTQNRTVVLGPLREEENYDWDGSLTTSFHDGKHKDDLTSVSEYKRRGVTRRLSNRFLL
ncbi:LAME_0H16908g1_1 [Lachancea meyersii CBS 8951]|uniref:LAME_0H16908g1_1 n=1 Tax=Lachancea meyersii CBS 8951 TaxID=1266667 RepID=A0A1G4KIB7_9SACH|nr:LAME_0H16908g1_1 [Lachancea meyersii CBS 8951]